MNLKEGLLLLGVLIALLCVPAAVSAAGAGGEDGCPYIKVILEQPKEYRNLNIQTMDALDPLDSKKTSVTLKSTESGNLKAIEGPLFGDITRTFCPSSGTYHGAKVTVVGDGKTIDGSTIPCYQHVYTAPTIPSFTVNVPGQCGNVLLIKCPESVNPEASFTEILNDAEKKGYLFTDNGILYFRVVGENVAGYANPFALPADEKDLNKTLNENKVNLSNFNFCTDKFDETCLNEISTPDAGEYLLTAVKYDSGCETMHVLAAMPVLILDGNPAVAWNGDNPYYQNQNKSATVSFGNNVNVDKIAYALVQKDTRYGLKVKVDTAEVAKQPIPTSPTDAISILKNIAGEGVPAEYTLTCGDVSKDVTFNKDSRLAIVEGYGCSGANDAPTVTIPAATLQELNPGTYYLYALGMDGQKVVAVDQKEVVIKAEPSGGGGGGGGSPSGGGPSGPTEPSGPVAYEGTGSLMTDSTGIVVQSIAVSAVDGVATVIVPAGVQALDANGNPLTEVGIEPLASDAVPAVPTGAVFAFAGYAYVASPAGATFDPAITLTLEIPEDVWNTLDLESEQLSVKWYNEETGLWEDVPTTFDPETRTVRATVTHFSIFALFTEPIEATVTPIETPTTTTTTTAPGGETPTEGLPVTMILGIFVVVIIIAAAGYFLLKRK